VDDALELIVGNGGRVAAIWLLLLVLAVIALAGLALPRGVHRPRQISAWLSGNRRRRREEAERRTADERETIRYAEEIVVATRGAESTAERRRADCRLAQSRVDETWRAYRAAYDGWQRARRAAAYHAPVSIPDQRDRDRALRLAAQAAYRRGDLSDTQLLDALTHRNGWNPRLHPVDQELALARAAAQHRYADYQSAVDAERETWQASDIAAAAVLSLRREVTAATARAGAASRAVPRQRAWSDEDTERVPVIA
jgi:hypothetical protein